MPVTTLDYYRQRRARKAAAGRRTGAPRLVKVKVQAAPVESPDGFTLVLVNVRRIESGWNFTDAGMRRLIGIVEAV